MTTHDGPTSILVRRIGPLATVQDLGRFGHAASGVPHSGAADLGSHRLANRLVGNDPAAATVEATAGGLVVTARGRATVAITGAAGEVTVDDRPVAAGGPVRLADGATLALGRPRSGLRSYLAVRGGVDVVEVLGSRSTDVLSGLGPAPLQDGDVLAVGTATRTVPTVDHAPRRPLDGALHLRAGPRADWVTDDALRRLGDVVWEVTNESNRVGIRLDGPRLEWREPGRELPSEGLVRGAVQVPPEGRPVIFLADHPVTGGYPVVAVVAAASLDHLGQLAPGDHVRLRRG